MRRSRRLSRSCASVLGIPAVMGLLLAVPADAADRPELGSGIRKYDTSPALRTGREAGDFENLPSSPEDIQSSRAGRETGDFGGLASSPEDIQVAREAEVRNAFQFLNYAAMSIARVRTSRSGRVVSEEHRSLLRNLDSRALAALPQDLQEFVVNDMMRMYSRDRLGDKDMELVRREYEAQVRKAFSGIRNEADIRMESMGAVAIRAAGAIKDGLLSAIFAAGGAAVIGLTDYMLALQENERKEQDARLEEELLTVRKDAGEWRLRKGREEDFDALEARFLHLSGSVPRACGLPESQRVIGRREIEAFLEFAAMRDPDKTLAKARSLERNLGSYPPFWLRYGQAAHRKGDRGKARECYETCERLSGSFLLRDRCLTDMARSKILLLEEHEGREMERLLGIIEDRAPDDDWNAVLFAALHWHAMGRSDRAENLLRRNRDDGFLMGLFDEHIRQLKAGRIEPAKIQEIVDGRAPGAAPDGDETESLKRAEERNGELRLLREKAEQGDVEAQHRLGMRMLDNVIALSLEAEGRKLAESVFPREKTGKGGIGRMDDLLSPAPWDEAARRFWLDEAGRLLAGAATRGHLAARYWSALARHDAGGGKAGPALAGLGRELAAQAEDPEIEDGMRLPEGSGARPKSVLEALYLLAHFHRRGMGPDMRHDAFRLFGRAAEGGHVRARMYEGFTLLEQDVMRGIAECQEAARMESTEEERGAIAQCNMGNLYALGLGVGRNPGQAVAWYRRAAERGLARAQILMGRCYELGVGVAKNPQMAVRWRRLAAEQGNPHVQYDLGVLCAGGEGGGSAVEAGTWFLRAAEQGLARAQLALGIVLMRGVGGVKNAGEAVAWAVRAAGEGKLAEAELLLGFLLEKGMNIRRNAGEAVGWYRRAADRGNAVAAFLLGECYARGRGVERDAAQAADWWRKASEGGVAAASLRLGFRHLEGVGIGQDFKRGLDLFRKAEAQAGRADRVGGGPDDLLDIGGFVDLNPGRAEHWFREGAEQEDGDTEDMFLLGICRSWSISGGRNAREAAGWFRKAAERELASGMLFLGVCYEQGDGLEKDAVQAAKWYRKAAERGLSGAQDNLGLCYENGRGVARDAVEAAAWYWKAAEQGHAGAQDKLGMCYENGWGVGKDAAMSVEWYRKAAEQGNAWGQLHLGNCYVRGRGVEKDEAMAVEWYRKAAEQGHAGAQVNLGALLRQWRWRRKGCRRGRRVVSKGGGSGRGPGAA